jgi:hypothetical protein
MENKNAIYNDDVEQIVNNPERQAAISDLHQKTRGQKKRKMFLDAVLYSILGCVIGQIGAEGLLVDWIAAPASLACLLYASFCFGRWFENGKCRGWK